MKKFIIYTDGGSRGNPGPSGIGVVIYNERGEVLKKYSQYLGDNLTNNETEYQAVILGIKKAKALYGKKTVKDSEIEIMSDSELLIKQLKGEYKILEPKIQSLFLKIWNFQVDCGKVKFTLIPRERNSEADSLVNEVLDSQKKHQKLF